jgi:hypothetical protein
VAAVAAVMEQEMAAIMAVAVQDVKTTHLATAVQEPKEQLELFGAVVELGQVHLQVTFK